MYELLFQFLIHLWAICLEAAPWLLLGLIVSGMIKVWLPAGLLNRWLGGQGLSPVLKASVIGTPLPLCSCSVVPAALTLRRSGASKGATVSFLVATPENGADSLALTYALLGPFMTIVRPIAAIFSAIAAGVLTLMLDDEKTTANVRPVASSTTQISCCSSAKSCGSSKNVSLTVLNQPDVVTADDKSIAVNAVNADTAVTQGQQPACHDSTTPSVTQASTTNKPNHAITIYRYMVDDLLGDIIIWLAVGLVISAVVSTFVPPDAMAKWGSGLLAMVLMLFVGVPMYICATASTPVAAAMLMAGVSPGTTLVFLLAGPATNIGTIGLVAQELGKRACIAYLGGVAAGAIISGLITDWLVTNYHFAVTSEHGDHANLIPAWLSITSLLILLFMTGQHYLRRYVASKHAASKSCCAV